MQGEGSVPCVYAITDNAPLGDRRTFSPHCGQRVRSPTTEGIDSVTPPAMIRLSAATTSAPSVSS